MGAWEWDYRLTQPHSQAGYTYTWEPGNELTQPHSQAGYTYTWEPGNETIKLPLWQSWVRACSWACLLSTPLPITFPPLLPTTFPLLSPPPPHPLPPPPQSCTSSEDCGSASVCLGLYVHPSQLDYPFNVRDNNTCGTCDIGRTLHDIVSWSHLLVTSLVAETSPGSSILQRFKVLVCVCVVGGAWYVCVCAHIQWNVLHLRMP